MDFDHGFRISGLGLDLDLVLNLDSDLHWGLDLGLDMVLDWDPDLDLDPVLDLDLWVGFGLGFCATWTWFSIRSWISRVGLGSLAWTCFLSWKWILGCGLGLGLWTWPELGLRPRLGFEFRLDLNLDSGMGFVLELGSRLGLHAAPR